MKERHPHRIYSNVSAREFALLQEICRAYGFKSIYHLLQALVRTLLKYARNGGYEEGGPESESIGKEVEDMFDEFLEPQGGKSFTTYKGRKEY